MPFATFGSLVGGCTLQGGVLYKYCRARKRKENMHSPLSCFVFASSSLRVDRVSHLGSYAVGNLTSSPKHALLRKLVSNICSRMPENSLIHSTTTARVWKSSTTKAKGRETANNLSPAPTSLPLLAEDEARLWQALAKERRESRLAPGGLVFSASASMAWSKGERFAGFSLFGFVFGSEKPHLVPSCGGFLGLRKVLRKTSCYMRELVGGGSRVRSVFTSCLMRSIAQRSTREFHFPSPPSCCGLLRVEHGVYGLAWWCTFKP